MNAPAVGTEILRLTVVVMGGFGLLVLVAGLIARARGRSPRSLVVKYLAWFLIIPLVLIPLVHSKVAFQLVVCLVSMLCFKEYSRACGLWEDRGLVVLSYGLMLFIYLPIVMGWYGLYQAAPLCAMVVLLLFPLWRNDYEHMIQKVCLALLGVLAFGYLLSHLAYLRNAEHGLAFAFLLMLLVACNDACGYLWGTFLGRHKLLSRISPAKTIEGAVGGALSVVALAFLFRRFLPAAEPIKVALIAILVAVCGVCGDLIISFIKRDLGVKDMGAAIPGHGGVLDRVDSLIFCAPVFFHVMRFCYG